MRDAAAGSAAASRLASAVSARGGEPTILDCASDGCFAPIVLKKSLARLLAAIFEIRGAVRQCFIAVLDEITNTSFAVPLSSGFFNTIRR
jgi:hypothetical protein